MFIFHYLERFCHILVEMGSNWKLASQNVPWPKRPLATSFIGQNLPWLKRSLAKTYSLSLSAVYQFDIVYVLLVEAMHPMHLMARALYRSLTFDMYICCYYCCHYYVLYRYCALRKAFIKRSAMLVYLVLEKNYRTGCCLLFCLRQVIQRSVCLCVLWIWITHRYYI